MPTRDNRPAAPGRIEPRLGSLEPPQRTAAPVADGLPHFSAEPRRQGAPRSPHPGKERAPSRTLRWLLLAVLLALLVVLAAQHRAWFARLFPSPQLDHLLDQGDRALAQGHLGDRHPPGALQYYQQAAQLSKDNSRAQAGLQAVGQAELARARAALDDHRLDDAAASLKRARALLGGGTALDALEQRLARARARGIKLADLIAQAQQAFAAGRLVGPDSAAGAYQQALQADPGNAVARHGLDQVGSALAAQARTALASGDTGTAATDIRQLAALLPAQADLPDLQAALAASQRAAQLAVAQMLAQAQKLVASGRITQPPGHNALDLYQQVLQRDPGNAEARAGLAQVSTALIVQAHAQIDAGDFSAAARLLDQAAALTPQSAELAAARARLTQAQNARSRPQVSPAQRRQAEQLVQRAQAAAVHGDYLMPPGSSAFDLYRQALTVDGESRAANDGLRALPEQAGQAAAQALHAGQLERAGDLLQSYAQLAPDAAGVASLQHALGTAWLERANSDLQHGDREGARSALVQARHWAPSDPRVLALAQGLGDS